MRMSDWSSDVCSSDLVTLTARRPGLTCRTTRKQRRVESRGRGCGLPKEKNGDEPSDRNAHATDRIAAGVGGCARAVAREGEGPDPRPRRPGRRTPADA